MTHSPRLISQPLEHPQGYVVAEGVCGDDQVRLVLVEALPEAPVARQVCHDLCPPPT